MRFNLFLILLFWCFGLLTGCSKISTNNSIIDQDTFVDLLVDIHMADATLAVKGYKINNDSITIRHFYNSVLLEHNVTKHQIQNTFQYYIKKPKKFEQIYIKVSEKIVKLEEEYDKNIKKAAIENKKDTPLNN